MCAGLRAANIAAFKHARHGPAQWPATQALTQRGADVHQPARHSQCARRPETEPASPGKKVVAQGQHFGAHKFHEFARKCRSRQCGDNGLPYVLRSNRLHLLLTLSGQQ